MADVLDDKVVALFLGEKPEDKQTPEDTLKDVLERFTDDVKSGAIPSGSKNVVIMVEGEDGTIYWYKPQEDPTRVITSMLNRMNILLTMYAYGDKI